MFRNSNRLSVGLLWLLVVVALFSCTSESPTTPEADATPASSTATVEKSTTAESGPITPEIQVEPTPTPTATYTPTPTPTKPIPPTKPAPETLPLGTVESKEVECQNTRQANCYEVTVSCPGLDDSTATLRVSGGRPNGTILLTTGGNGDSFYRSGGEFNC